MLARKCGIAALLVVQSLLVACAAGPGARTAQVQNRRVEFSMHGQGAPVVVFESGLGDGLSPWNSVASRIAKRTQVLTYSRAGYDRSTASKAPREPATIAAELDELLQALSLRPPYVLVGHSIGALYIQAYAAAHPDRVAALVLVDPTHPDQLSRMRHAAPVDAALVNTLSHLFVGSMRGEFDAYVRAGFSPPAYPGPVIVLGAQRLQAGSTPTFQKLRVELLKEIAAHYPQSELRWIDASHYIQREQPQAVSDAIATVLDRLGSQGAR
jgi:pimeloyl-ACP methyl ester carboxylesterase